MNIIKKDPLPLAASRRSRNPEPKLTAHRMSNTRSSLCGLIRLNCLCFYYCALSNPHQKLDPIPLSLTYQSILLRLLTSAIVMHQDLLHCACLWLLKLLFLCIVFILSSSLSITLPLMYILICQSVFQFNCRHEIPL